MINKYLRKITDVLENSYNVSNETIAKKLKEIILPGLDLSFDIKLNQFVTRNLFLQKDVFCNELVITPIISRDTNHETLSEIKTFQIFLHNDISYWVELDDLTSFKRTLTERI